MIVVVVLGALAAAASASAPPPVVGDACLAGVATMARVMTPAFFSPPGPLQQFYAELCAATVAKETSTVCDGRGLFAKKGIKKGQIVSLYPAHALGVADAGGAAIFATTGDDAAHFRAHAPAASSYLHATDQPLFQRPSFAAAAAPRALRDSWRNGGDEDEDGAAAAVAVDACYLDAHAARVDPGWGSHLINDGAAPESADAAAISAYYERSARARNCVHVPWGPSPLVATVATRKIRKGEELLTSYGCVYWLGELARSREGAAAPEEDPGLTAEIDAQIQASARDLFDAIKAAAAPAFQARLAAVGAQFDAVRVDAGDAPASGGVVL